MSSFKLTKFKHGFLETASSGGNLALVANSNMYQVITGSLGHTVTLPDATTMGTGLNFIVINTSTGSVDVKNNGGTTLATLTAGSGAEFELTNNGSANGVWRTYSAGSAGAGGLGSKTPTSTKTSNYTIVSGDDGATIPVDSTSGVIEITLPSPASAFKVTIKDAAGKASQNAIWIKRSSSSVKIDQELNDDYIVTNYNAISYISNGTDWFRISCHTSPVAIGMFAGGLVSSTPQNIIEHFNIALASNSVDFGDLTQSRGAAGACSNGIAGIFMGGSTTGGTGAEVNTIDFVIMSIASNATDFGDLTITKDYGSSASNSVRGLHAGGYKSAAYNNVIDYITMATAGNATDFGDLIQNAQTQQNGMASPVRALWKSAGAFGGGIEYVTIATTGNATSFGTLSLDRSNSAGCSSSVRGLFGGGNTGSLHDIIDYVTIATTGNAIDFGDLTVARSGLSACSSKIRGVFGAGTNFSINLTVLDYVTIANLGNAANFGDLIVARVTAAACSNAHGGL